MTRAARPDRLADALTALAEPGAVAVAGCTDLLVVDTATGRRHDAVVDVLRLAELRGVAERDGRLDIGAATTFAELRRAPLVVRHAPILAEAAATIGGWQIQNRATLGGNVANASPVGDSLPTLLALGAELVVASAGGQRVIDYATFHTGYRETALAAGELIVRVRVPLATPGEVQRFKKAGTRAAQAISKVVVALRAERSPEGALTGVRLAAGAVAPTPVRLAATEALLEGARPDGTLAERAAAAARAEVAPIDDARSTARYRSFVLGRIVRRMVLSAAASER